MRVAPAVRGVAIALLGFALEANAQAPTVPNCDSIIARAAVDSVESGLFLAVRRRDGLPLSAETQRRLIMAIGAWYSPPRPFKVGIFAGPAIIRTLRPRMRDSSSGVNRSPYIAGTYRVVAGRGMDTVTTEIVRASLLASFDTAAIDAIRHLNGLTPQIFPLAGEDTSQVDVRIASDSVAGAVRLFSTMFPRMPVLDAVPLRGGPPPELPPGEPVDSTFRGADAVFRFVVDREGVPLMSTVEIVRRAPLPYLRAAAAALAQQRFLPAAINGCAVAQSVEMSITFAPATPQKAGPHASRAGRQRIDGARRK